MSTGEGGSEIPKRDVGEVLRRAAAVDGSSPAIDGSTGEKKASVGPSPTAEEAAFGDAKKVLEQLRQEIEKVADLVGVQPTPEYFTPAAIIAALKKKGVEEKRATTLTEELYGIPTIGYELEKPTAEEKSEHVKNIDRYRELLAATKRIHEALQPAKESTLTPENVSPHELMILLNETLPGASHPLRATREFATELRKLFDEVVSVGDNRKTTGWLILQQMVRAAEDGKVFIEPPVWSFNPLTHDRNKWPLINAFRRQRIIQHAALAARAKLLSKSKPEGSAAVRTNAAETLEAKKTKLTIEVREAVKKLEGAKWNAEDLIVYIDALKKVGETTLLKKINILTSLSNKEREVYDRAERDLLTIALRAAAEKVEETDEQRAERERIGQETRDVARRTGESHYRLRRIDEYIIIQAALNAKPPELDKKHVDEFYEWKGARLMSTSVPRFFGVRRKKEMPPIVRAVEKFINDKLAAKRAEQKVALRDKNKNEKEKEFNEAVTVGKKLFSEQHSELNAALSRAVAEKTLQLLTNDVNVFYAMYEWFRDVNHILEFKPSSISSVFGELLTSDQKRSLTKVQRFLRPLVEGPTKSDSELGRKWLETHDPKTLEQIDDMVTKGLRTSQQRDTYLASLARQKRVRTA